MPMRQCQAGHSATPALTLSIAWRKSRNDPSAPNAELFSLMVMLWTCLSKVLDALQQVVVEELVRLPLRLVQYLGGLYAGLHGSPPRRLHSLRSVKCRSHTCSYFSKRIFGGQSGGLVFFVSSLSLYHSRLRGQHTLALFLDPLLGETQVHRPSLRGWLAEETYHSRCITRCSSRDVLTQREPKG